MLSSGHMVPIYSGERGGGAVPACLRDRALPQVLQKRWEE